MVSDICWPAGYQLTSAECYDLRSGRVVVDQYCHYYPENVKPKPKLQECNMELNTQRHTIQILTSANNRQSLYDVTFHDVRWESSPWTACSTSCGGGIQSRLVSCVEEDMQGTITPTEEWKYCQNPKPSPLQACNRFDCPPMWDTHDWGQCSQSCGGGVQRRQVLCKQRLADGSILELPDTFCPTKSPTSQQPCGEKECPPEWVTTSWSQVAYLSARDHSAIFLLFKWTC
uniref:Uncharacterized protein n=1 Tax=Neolamprologus brichardi TaxID=32507 RepID=A0A3Q4MH58_NEOBR